MSLLTFYTISKGEITTCDFARFDKILRPWPKLCGAKLGAKYNSLLFSVEGYDDHPEELYMIPLVRHYFRELHARWPWFLFFIYDYDASLAMPYLCLLESVQCVKRAESNRCAAAYNPDELLPYLQKDFGHMNQLFERAGLPETENEKRTQRIFETFLPNFSVK